MLPWQRRRIEFNHDWLKNRFLPAIAKSINLLDGELEDLEFEQKFVARDLAEWELSRSQILSLTADFEIQMSPRTLFEQVPLSCCDDDTREWLGQLVHDFWLSRYPVRQWIEHATECTRAADKTYNRLHLELDQCPDTRSATALRPLRPLFAEFWQACMNLAKAIERFPSEVLVI